MLIRTVTGAVLGLVLLVPSVVFSGTPVLPLICGALSALGVFEMLRCLGTEKRLSLLIPSVAFGFYLPVGIRYTNAQSGYYTCAVLVFLYALYMLSVTVFSGNGVPFGEVSGSLAMTVYIAVGFASVVALRDIENGQYLLPLIFIGAWITDIFAYLCGRAFGRHKLCPSVSPKKTIEGSVGGSVCCALAFVGYAFLLNGCFSLNANPVTFGVIGLCASVVSQIGDLLTSAIKRQCDIKDFGKIFPGHGGVLDRFDSVLSVGPALLLLCIAFTSVA